MKIYKLIVKHKDPMNNLEIDFINKDNAIRYRNLCIEQGCESAIIKEVFENNCPYENR